MHPIDFTIVIQPQTMPAQPISRRKKFNYYGNKAKKYPHTDRTEMSAVERAFAVGALTAMRGDYATQRDLARTMGRQQGSLSKLLNRVEAKANNKTRAIWDEILYENDLGRGRSRLLTRKQKEDIICIATSSRSTREKESWQAIAHGDFESVVPKISISTFENVMYEAGYARRRPGWKPHLTDEQEQVRYEWAIAHNPDRDEEYDGKGYDFTQVVFTDETPARIGEERGMMRTWCCEGERWDDDVKHDRNRKDCCLQFYAAFRYNFKGPCHVYREETEAEKQEAAAHIQRLNVDQKTRDNKLQIYARQALHGISESDVNGRYNTRKKQYVPSKMDYHRGDRARGGVDGYRHREGALKKVVPWIHELEKKGIKCVIQQDGAPAHKSRISRDYLTTEMIDMLWWPGHSPEVNAIEHAWPWIRRHVTKQFTPSRTESQCEQQWVSA
jgi:hypothetical protein